MYRNGCPLAKDRLLSRSRAVHCGPGVADELLPYPDSPVIQCHPSMGRDVLNTQRSRTATPKHMLLRQRHVTFGQKSTLPAKLLCLLPSAADTTCYVGAAVSVTPQAQ